MVCRLGADSCSTGNKVGARLELLVIQVAGQVNGLIHLLNKCWLYRNGYRPGKCTDTHSQ